jgi:hypothetical protein
MSESTQETAVPSIGLDIGTSRIVTAQQNGGGNTQVRSELNAFVTLPFSKLTQSVLRKEAIPHTVEGSELVIYGNESEKLADLFHVETRRPMLRGVLNPGEPNSLDLVRQLVTSLTSDTQAERICFSVPAPTLGSDENVTYHEASLRNLLTGLGYEVRSIPEGLAVIYSELEDVNYTGIGVSCGGGMCNVCLAYLSVPVLSYSIPKAGDYIDMNAATATGEVSTRVRILKEQSFHFNGTFSDKVQQAVNVYYDDVIRSLVRSLVEALETCRHLAKMGRQIPLVLSGGTVTPRGFRDRFAKAMEETEFPINISEVRMASEPLYSTAKGALMAALTDM